MNGDDDCGPACLRCGRPMAVVRIRMPLVRPHEVISFACRPCGVTEPGPRRFEGDATPRA